MLLRNVTPECCVFEYLRSSDPNGASHRQEGRNVGETQPHASCGIPPATTMLNGSLSIRRRLVLSKFCETPETLPRKRAKVARDANSNRASGRKVCR